MKLRSCIKIHGGKNRLSKYIIESFPVNYQKMTYVETHGGAGNVLQTKIRSAREIYNDLDPELVNVFWHVVFGGDEFFRQLRDIPYTKESFEFAKAKKDSDSSRAVAEIVLRRMSRGGLQKEFAWSERLRGGMPGDVNSWITFLKQLEQLRSRWSGVLFHNKKANDIISRYDSLNTLFYIDPPYLPVTRRALKIYGQYEMTEEQHVELAGVLNSVKGKVILSGYPSSLYDTLYSGWRQVQKSVKNNSGQGKKKQDRTEVLWFNWNDDV